MTRDADPAVTFHRTQDGHLELDHAEAVIRPRCVGIGSNASQVTPIAFADARTIVRAECDRHSSEASS